MYDNFLFSDLFPGFFVEDSSIGQEGSTHEY